MTYPPTKRVRRCRAVENGLQCAAPDPRDVTLRIGGGFYDTRHTHRFDPDDAGYADWRRYFAKVRVPR